MTRLPRFWKALTEIPGTETDTREWRHRLGDEFPLVHGYLRATGALARSVDCPSPGGEHCPRKVLDNGDRTYRAVCQSPEVGCETLTLSRTDIAILAVDRARLLRGLARALDSEPADRPVDAGKVMLVGRHALTAGLASPILLALPGPADVLAEDDLRAAGLDPSGSIVLVPRPSSLYAPLQVRLVAAGHQMIPLSEAIGIGASGFEALQPPAILLAPIRDALAARIKAHPGAPTLQLPPGTRWEQITLLLTSSATLVCRTPGWSRQLDPGGLGMRSAKNNRHTLAWTLLVSLAELGGAISVRDRSKEASFRKQKEHLSKRLRAAFGLAEDPLPWDATRRAYVARFIIRDERPVEERGSRRR